MSEWGRGGEWSDFLGDFPKWRGPVGFPLKQFFNFNIVNTVLIPFLTSKAQNEMI